MFCIKNADEQFKKLGYEKRRDSDFVVQYAKYEPEFHFAHVIELNHNYSGKHRIHSFVGGSMNSKYEHTSCALTLKEAKLALKKAKEKGWKVE